MKNPFEFGRELSNAELVDRDDELAAVVRAMEEGERLFLIGPRRFGKTSILRAAAERAEKNNTVVLRHNAEAYPTLVLMAQAIVEEAAKELAGSAERAGKKVREFFGALRPQLTYNPLDQSFSVSLTAASTETASEPALLTQVLDGLNAMAADSKKRVAVVIDEFQHIVEQGGIAAERQIRAAVQKHDHLAYVFAGSKTSMLTEMTGDPSRPFYRLGTRLFVGPIPRVDFAEFIKRGFADAGFEIEKPAVEGILNLAEDVPYNVQRLAHECWNTMRSHDRDAEDQAFSSEDVFEALVQLVKRDDPFYTQMWNRLAATQRTALLALVLHKGTGLFTESVLKTFGIALSTMRTALKALAKTGIAREEETQGSVRLRLEDPFFAQWIALFVVHPLMPKS